MMHDSVLPGGPSITLISTQDLVFTISAFPNTEAATTPPVLFARVVTGVWRRLEGIDEREDHFQMLNIANFRMIGDPTWGDAIRIDAIGRAVDWWW